MDYRNARAPSPGSGLARPLYDAFSACTRIAPEHRPVTLRAERSTDMAHLMVRGKEGARNFHLQNAGG